jgi:hypothetical protein
MTFISMNLDEVQEAKPAPIGRYLLRIDGTEVRETGPASKSPGQPMLKVIINVLDVPDAQAITHFITFPTPTDDQDNAKFKMLNLKRFLQAFNIRVPKEGVDLEQLSVDCLGAEASCDLTLSEPDDNGNVYNRLRLPRLVDEATNVKPPRKRG